jgi:hypothetical protein
VLNVLPLTLTICTAAVGCVVAGRAGVVDPAGVDVDGVEVDPPGFVVGCDCDVVTGGLRVDAVLRFVVCASDAGANVRQRLKIKRVIRALFGAAGFV